MTSMVIGDDHGIFLDALSGLLAQRGFKVTVARTAAETLGSVRDQRPDVCLLDRHFAAEDGIKAIADIIAASPLTTVLVLSADADTDGILEALQAGSSGYVHKNRGVSALTAAIDRALRGEVVVDVPKDNGYRRSRERDHAHRLAAFLTEREWHCLELLVEGASTAAMAVSLGISPATVRTHVQAVLLKLGVHSRLEAAAYAVRYGLVDGARPASVASSH
jgi:two-component system, NarL family, nitrate/nitrite response regulator NarL